MKFWIPPDGFSIAGWLFVPCDESTTPQPGQVLAIVEYPTPDTANIFGVGGVLKIGSAGAYHLAKIAEGWPHMQKHGIVSLWRAIPIKREYVPSPLATPLPLP